MITTSTTMEAMRNKSLIQINQIIINGQFGRNMPAFAYANPVSVAYVSLWLRSEQTKPT